MLGYPEDASLPPREANHVIKFILLFSNGLTAANYVNHVVSGCKFAGCSVLWHNADVLEAKKNARLRSNRMDAHINAEESFVLSCDVLVKVVESADNAGDIVGPQNMLFW